MRRRVVLQLTSTLVSSMSAPLRAADASRPALASYYDLHMALLDRVAYAWQGRGMPRRQRANVVAVGVSRLACFALLGEGSLHTWGAAADPATLVRPDVAGFAAGESGWFALDREHMLWHASGTAAARRVASAVRVACIGDGADYFIGQDGRLFVKGLAHRGQYGDGRLVATTDYVATADDAVVVKAHTGHALYLRRDGMVMGTGGNRFGPLSRHGLGDKADRWGPIFEGARAITTGSRHSLAIRHDGSLWAWGEGFGIEPAKVFDGVAEVAAGDTATIALTADGRLWQWDAGTSPRRLYPV